VLAYAHRNSPQATGLGAGKVPKTVWPVPFLPRSSKRGPRVQLYRVHGCFAMRSLRLLATTVACCCEETAGHVGSGLVKESLSDEESIDAQAQNHQYL
jgi:hypothetical protein